MEDKKITTIDAYIAEYPPELQEKLQALRIAINNVLPNAVEKISWGMPTFAELGNVIHFAGFKKHIGIYPGPEAIAFFGEKIAPYHHSKGAIQFPWNEAMPYELIQEIALFNLSGNIKDAEIKASAKKKKNASS